MSQQKAHRNDDRASSSGTPAHAVTEMRRAEVQQPHQKTSDDVVELI